MSTFAPSGGLRDLVAGYWTGRWDLRGQAPHEVELLADPCVNLVFEAGGAHAGSRLVGVWTRLWRRTLEDRGLVRGVKLRAGAVRAFVDRPAYSFTNRIVPLISVFGDEVVATERAVLAPDDDHEALALIERWLLERRRPDDFQVALAVGVIERIAAHPEITTVERLAEVAGSGPRALQRLFREYVGATPKWVIRRNRLQEAALRLERGDGLVLADIAAELHYADHAHLARDFKQTVGRTPSAFAAQAARDRQPSTSE